MSTIALTHSRKKNHTGSVQTKSSPFIFVLTGALLVAGFFGLQGFLSSSYFQIKEIRWAGMKQIDRKELDQQFQFVLGQNLIRLSIAKIHTALLNNRWVKEAVVSKVYPNRVAVTLTERVPAAVEIDPVSNRMILRDGEGVVLEEGEQDHLPRMIYYNPNAYGKALELAPLLAERKDALIDLSHAENISVRLKKGVLHLGDKDFKKRWEKFSKVEADLDRRNVAPWEADLRFPSQVVVKTKTASAETEE
ncbi:MAG: FtsQ-type POTRA domain-containing protein [Nitrospirae bacterium]|nr:FtsQ-type POTRA domain-containing protein [Candidatus Troglogloeales bacterium]MBI3598016.1 FtsQ-type POTRA domain-containing protein [Candidatus Troglogloeales bacterium]